MTKNNPALAQLDPKEMQTALKKAIKSKSDAIFNEMQTHIKRTQLSRGDINTAQVVDGFLMAKIAEIQVVLDSQELKIRTLGAKINQLIDLITTASDDVEGESTQAPSPVEDKSSTSPDSSDKSSE